MRKRLAVGLAGIMMVSALVGCGEKTTTKSTSTKSTTSKSATSSQYLLDINYSDYVELCEYKGIDASKPSYEVTDEEIQEEIDNQLYDNVTYDEITDRGVEESDYANITYTATVDGEVSEYYSGEDEEYMIGDGSFYPEAEKVLVGMKTGEQVEVEVELTEDFADEGDIGKKATLAITLNGISVENIPEYNAEYVKEYTDYETMEEYEEAVKEEVIAYKEETYQYVATEDIFTYVLENSKFNGYPDELYQQCETNYDSNNESMAAMYGMELADYLELFGIDDKTREEDIKYNVNYDLVIGAIAQNEGIDCTEEEINQYVEEYYEDYGYLSADEFFLDYTAEDVGYQLIYEKVADFLYEQANLTEVSEEQFKKDHPEEFEDEELEVEEEDEEEAVDEGENAVELEEEK